MSSNRDPWADPEAQEWLEHCNRTLVPMLDNSACSVSIAPPAGSSDIKYAVELGLSIMMEKPILVVAEYGQRIPDKLRMLADDIAYVDWNDEASKRSLAQYVQKFAERYR
jgi:hypothetical protein